MTAYLQFDSIARSDPYILIGGKWFPNDVRYQSNPENIQTSTNYRVFYKELNNYESLRTTIGYASHCHDQQKIITYSVEFCSLQIPHTAKVKRIEVDGTTSIVKIANEPYLYVSILPTEESETGQITTNNNHGEDAIFVVYIDKQQIGDVDTWLIYKTCQTVVQRWKLDTDSWSIKISDRFGNIVELDEPDNAAAGYTTKPFPDPSKQTNILLGITPNYSK